MALRRRTRPKQQLLDFLVGEIESGRLLDAQRDERDRAAVERRLVHRLERLGYRVTLEPAAA
jgi:hypothetical protein